MKKIKALLVVVCTGVLLTACGNSSQKGVEYLEDGKYDQAIEQFEPVSYTHLTLPTSDLV